MRRLLFLSVLILAGCDPSTREFNLPPGDVEQGRANFILLQCDQCHSIADIPWGGANLAGPIHVQLGGKTTQAKTYADLVTSIIHPSHKLSRAGTADDSGQSRMRNYNDVMSVQELIDLVAFVEDQYELWVPEYYTYKNSYDNSHKNDYRNK